MTDQPVTQEPGTIDVAPTTTAEAPAMEESAFASAFSVTPRVGIFGYEDGLQSYTSRILEGITVNFNLSPVVAMPAGWVFGLESGLLYSHLGSPTSNFFGTSSTIQTTEGANGFLVPITAQFGYRPTDNSMFAINLGSNMIYRSIGQSMNLGRPNDTSPDGGVDFFPSLGVNLGWDISRVVGLSVRGDYIPTPTADSFTATLGATIGIA